MKENQVFSVVIPAYKSGEMWRDSIASVLMQDYPAIELIFSDDGTPEFNSRSLREFIENNKSGNLVHYEILCHEQNMGTVQNFRAAHKRCTGHYLTHLAVDDAYCDNSTLTRFAEALKQKTKDVLGVYANSLVCDVKMNPLGYISFDTVMAQQMNAMKPEEQFGRICRSCCIHMGATAFIRSEFMATGDFDTDYQLIEDWPFILEATRQGKKFLHLPFDAINYRNGGVTDAPFDSSVKKACCADHIRLYERKILPYLKLIPYKDRLAVYGKYAEDRMDMEFIFDTLSELSLLQKWKYSFIYLPVEIKRLVKRKWKICIVLLAGMAVLLCYGQKAAALLYAALVICANLVKQFVRHGKKNLRFTQKERQKNDQYQTNNIS